MCREAEDVGEIITRLVFQSPGWMPCKKPVSLIRIRRSETRAKRCRKLANTAGVDCIFATGKNKSDVISCEEMFAKRTLSISSGTEVWKLLFCSCTLQIAFFHPRRLMHAGPDLRDFVEACRFNFPVLPYTIRGRDLLLVFAIPPGERPLRSRSAFAVFVVPEPFINLGGRVTPATGGEIAKIRYRRK
jgi:hypothetical protein